MKKLIMTVAIVCAAVCAQASAVSWSASGLVDINGTALKTSTLMSSYTIVCTIWDSTGNTKLTDSAGTLDMTLGSVKGNWDGASTGTSYYGQLVITDSAGNTLKSEKALFTTDQSATYKPNFGTGSKFAASGSKFNQGSSVNDGYGWTAVPEPTSGLLLLLGMSVLALKRKCA